MKKIKFLLGMLTIAASTSLLSSCFTDPTFGEAPNVPAPVEEAEYTINVTTNVAAKLSYDGIEYNNGGQNFEFKATKNSDLVVSANGYVSQTIPVTLGSNKNIAINVTLIKTPVNPDGITIGDANNNTTSEITVTNDSENQTASGGKATIVIPANVTEKGGMDSDAEFGIGVYKTVSVGEEPTKEDEGKEEAYDVLVAVCEPTGAEFDNAVTITVPTDGAAGLSFRCTNGGDVASNVKVAADGKFISADVMHFSNWTFSLLAKIVSVTTEQVTLFDGNILVKGGANPFNYNAFGPGAVLSGSGASRGIIQTFVASQFGSVSTGSKVARTNTFSSTGTGSAHIRVVQEKKTINYNSNGVTFTATVYGAVKFDVISVTPDTSEHSGGNGNN